jgi:hypothetical protein
MLPGDPAVPVPVPVRLKERSMPLVLYTGFNKRKFQTAGKEAQAWR